MAGAKRLYLYWDPAIDGAFRRRLERALGGLKLDVADGEMVDVDPENAPLVMAIASAAGGWAPPGKADIVIQGGPGQFLEANGALRLVSADIENGSARWTRLVDKLRAATGLASLALPAEDLEIRLNEASRRADDAEARLQTALLDQSNAVRDKRRLEIELGEARKRIAELEQDKAELNILNQTGRFAIGNVPREFQEAVAEARRHAWRAEMAAARGAEAAAASTAAGTGLAWSVASYAGETMNGAAHGYGVTTFGSSASYRGQFFSGKRHGFGVGETADGFVWSGAWRNDEACGAGILEGPAGERVEGEVEHAEQGPRRVKAASYRWPAAEATGRRAPHHAVRVPLPAPAK